MPALEERLLEEDGEAGIAVNNINNVEDPVPVSARNSSIRPRNGGWKACRFIIGTEFCERLSFVGIYINLVVFLTTKMHQGNAVAAASVTSWSGTCYFTSFIGAFLADSYWGRYWTIGILSIAYVIGMVLLTVSASLPSMSPPACSSGSCENPSTAQTAFLYTALYLIAFGTGGIKPCVSVYGADQFDSGNPVESAQMTSFFNWFYFSVNVGSLIASTFLVYLQENVGWGVGYGVSSFLMLAAIATFFSGTSLYRNQKPGGSPLTRILQVLVAAYLKRKADVPCDEQLLYELPDRVSAINGSRKLQHSSDLRCFDKAATRIPADIKENRSSSWRLCTVTQVEEVKIIIRILPIWAATIIYYTVYAQMTTFFVEQGMRMDSELGSSASFRVAPASMITINILTSIISIPVYDWYFAPFVARFTGYKQGLSQLSRISIGLFLATVSMLVAAAVEMRRLQLAADFQLLDDATEPSPMSILWQVPQYMILGFAEVFTNIGQLEFFYDQSPDAMRSLGSALALSTAALGNYLSSVLVTVFRAWIPNNLNRGHLDYFFIVVALVNALNQIFFWVCSRNYKYNMRISC